MRLLSQTDPAARRRHAAVLFADLTGFTALVESATPETVYAVVRPLMDKLAAVVRAYGGDIQQVLGDGFMSVFGLRSARGNEVERAVRTAVALVRVAAAEPGRPLPVHVGVECGEVLVSPSWEAARFGVWGRAVVTAKRLCDEAGPSTIHFGPEVYADGAGPVLADLGAPPARSVRMAVQGNARELSAYRVCAAAELTDCAA